MINWLKNLSDNAKAGVYLGGLLLAAISGALALNGFVVEFRGLPKRMSELESKLELQSAEIKSLSDRLETVENQAVRYGIGVGLKVSYESTIYQMDACISCPDGQRPAYFAKDNLTQHQVYLTKEP